MKHYLLEHEMEKFLIMNGYDIYDSENCVDSVKVSDLAVDEFGFKSEMNAQGEIIFFKDICDVNLSRIEKTEIVARYLFELFEQLNKKFSGLSYESDFENGVIQIRISG